MCCSEYRGHALVAFESLVFERSRIYFWLFLGSYTPLQRVALDCLGMHSDQCLQCF